MAHQPRMTTNLVEHTEDLLDICRVVERDDVIDLDEWRRVKEGIRLVYQEAVGVDESAAITVAMLRLGPDSERVNRLMGERRSRLRLVVRNENPDLGPRAA